MFKAKAIHSDRLFSKTPMPDGQERTFQVHVSSLRQRGYIAYTFDVVASSRAEAEQIARDEGSKRAREDFDAIVVETTP